MSINPDCQLGRNSTPTPPNLPLCEHPLRGLPAWPPSGGGGAGAPPPPRGAGGGGGGTEEKGGGGGGFFEANGLSGLNFLQKFRFQPEPFDLVGITLDGFI